MDFMPLCLLHEYKYKGSIKDKFIDPEWNLLCYFTLLFGGLRLVWIVNSLIAKLWCRSELPVSLVSLN